ncbi:MAG: prolipoprotein diacylglyceryl transferase family protein, partial [Candidatus Wukongarchaeota archaeon]|nr:prolipoprotein diacylglyceryl transferase [Candidatus Wukongarchaeota archaeon]
LLFIVLWWIKDFHFKKGTIFCLFLIFYSIFRFFIEFFREPDPQLGLIFSFITMGQALSVVMCILGLVLLYFRPEKGELRK